MLFRGSYGGSETGTSINIDLYLLEICDFSSFPPFYICFVNLNNKYIESNDLNEIHQFQGLKKTFGTEEAQNVPLRKKEPQTINVFYLLICK